MRQPLIVSSVLHGAVLLLLLLGLPASDRKLDLPPSIPIEVVDIGEITEAARMDKGEPNASSAPKAPMPEAKPAPPAPPVPDPDDSEPDRKSVV